MDIGSPTSGGIGVSYPASLAQSRFWVLDALDPGTPALNVAVRWTLHGHVTPDMAQAALQQTVARHEILRTALVEVDGSPVQLVRPSLTLPVRHYDLSGLDKADAAAEADRIGEEEARTPFCLEVPPLMRAALITFGRDTSRLLLTLHHAVCDGWSIGVIAEEFTSALAGAPRRPELPLQYGNYAEWQQAWLESPALEEATAYWRTQLAGLPYAAVPPDHAAEERGRGAIASILLPRALTDEMSAAAMRQGCTPFSVALAALASVVQARARTDDVAIGTQVAGRTEVELEGMIGPFINTLVLRLDLSGSPAWDERVRRAASVVDQALHHHAMPFEALIRVLNPPRVRGRTPLFSVNFIFQRSFVAPSPQAGITLVDMPSHSAGALYDLNFFMVERPDGWRASCEYDTALFERSTVEAMLADWRSALEGKPLTSASVDPVLERMRAIWCETLGLQQIAPEDGFFDLGGHSLLAARMLAKVESVFGRRVGMAALFAAPTLGDFAALFGNAGRSAAGAQFVAIGSPAEWSGFSEAIGPAHAFSCATGADPQPGSGPLVVLGAGDHGAAALDLAMAYRRRDRQVTLVLIDAKPPRPKGLLARLVGGRADTASQFDGRTLLFRDANSMLGIDAWANRLGGELEVLTLPKGAWQAAVAAGIIAALR